MLLELAFTSPGEHVTEAEPLSFCLYEVDESYVLPEFAVRYAPGAAEVELREATISSVTPADGEHGPLAAEIAAAWQAEVSSIHWSADRGDLVARTRMPASFMNDAGAQGQPAEFAVTWYYVFTDMSGAAAFNEVLIRVKFMPRGLVPPPRPARRPDPYALRHGLPAALRQLGDRAAFTGFAAIDFGSSSSTVAIHDTRLNTLRSIDIGQGSRLREELAKLLADHPPPPLADEWHWQLAWLVGAVRQEFPAANIGSAADLVVQLGGPTAGWYWSGPTDGLLDAVCSAIEKSVSCCSPALAHWLAPKLLYCFDQSFSVPNLDELQLAEVVFDADDNQREIASSFRITETDPVEIQLGVRDHDAEHGLKSKLFQAEPRPGLFGKDHREATTDDLVARVYLRLVTLAEEFARRDKEAPVEPLARVVATCPTATRPSARLRLEQLLRHCLGLSQVVTIFDEGVAAGLYFLMRDFGTRHWEFGVDALRAQSTRVNDDPPTWRQTMLVIDIGADTTDIALLGLTLQDFTPGPASHSTLTRGRHYILKLQVLNSAGYSQLGGNYLTLRIFYWLKAAILDALLDGPGAQELAPLIPHSLHIDGILTQLAPMVANSGIGEPAPPEVAALLRTILPTHWKNDDSSQARQAFKRLWDTAEAVKVNFSDSSDTALSIDQSQIRAVLSTIDDRPNTGLPALLPLWPDKPLALLRKDFEALARPVLEEAAELAAFLAATTLDAEENMRLDRVALSGKTSRLPLLAQIVREVLGADDPWIRTRLPWNPAALETDAERAKQATVLGACWAQSIRERGTGGGGDGELDRGRTQLTIEVDSLFHALPCSFDLLLTAGQTAPLLEPGTKLIEADANGPLIARSRWVRLLPTFEIHRPWGRERIVQWGVFSYYKHRNPDGFKPNPAIWGPTEGGTKDAEITAMLEIDQNLTPYLHLCYGDPHFVVEADVDEQTGLRLALSGSCWDAGGRLRELPAAIWVMAREADGSREQRMELFPAIELTDSQSRTAYFGSSFHVDHDLTSTAVPGRISAPLPLPPYNGEYVFYLRWPDGTEKPLPPLRARGQRTPTARYVATLDEHGTLRLHRGELPFWPASGMRDVEETKGSVLKVKIDEDVPGDPPGWDPFDGWN